MAAPTVVLTIIKAFSYRGVANERWSNTYFLTGSTPANSTAWRALFDALNTQERTLYTSDVSIVGGYAYDRVPAKGDSAIWSVDLTQSPNTPLAGSLSTPAGSAKLAGDQAVWIRWGLDRMNTKGKRVYLRKYYHGAACNSTTPDSAYSGWITAANAFGTKMRDGTFDSGRVLTDRLGTALVGSGSSSFVTTRTLKRRGKRPPT